MTAVRWARYDRCTVVTLDGRLAGYVYSAEPGDPQAEVQVMIPSICLLAVFPEFAGRWCRGSWEVVPGRTGEPTEVGIRPDAEEWIERWRLAGEVSERSDLVEHLHTHPDHAGRYPAGHDFVLMGTADIRRDHLRQHGDESVLAEDRAAMTALLERGVTEEG